jgi:1-acyl-sn-glycerol-3-phosphate acyltransferase
MHIGKAFRLPPIEGQAEQRRARRQESSDIIMNHIAGLLPPEYRGVYADTAVMEG